MWYFINTNPNIVDPNHTNLNTLTLVDIFLQKAIQVHIHVKSFPHILLHFQTSNTACFLLYELAKHPELQERLVQEASLAMGDKDHPSWEDLQKMTLLRNCVKEVMRLHTPVPASVRILTEDVVLLGYQVPAGVS